MRRQCARPGCSAPATATFTFDSRACTVWLDPVSDAGARAGDLCDRHAHRLGPPRGWELVDRRVRQVVSAATAPATADPEPALASAPRRVARPSAGPPLTTPSFDDLDAPVAIDQSPSIDAPVPWAPRFDPADDLDGLLDAHSPLLGRAFRNLRAV
ncbi:MAG TPA: DUF3499 family protein [Acidimicrobiia bacterium]|nr:DUF3499 family protein [Acidimicrobiia bacterium]